jgi:hypothetical protein
LLFDVFSLNRTSTPLCWAICGVFVRFLGIPDGGNDVASRQEFFVMRFFVIVLALVAVSADALAKPARHRAKPPGKPAPIEQRTLPSNGYAMPVR